MGTRASFWVGNPQELDKREWLGCVAWDGYPEGIGGIEQVNNEAQFRKLVETLSSRKDFSRPDKGWPFPWANNIFLTDYTYAFFDGKLQMACFHRGFMSLEEYEKENQSEETKPDTLPDNVPAPKPYNPKQPDSIIVVTKK